jgi:hypothetical protein
MDGIEALEEGLEDDGVELPDNSYHPPVPLETSAASLPATPVD